MVCLHAASGARLAPFHLLQKGANPICAGEALTTQSVHKRLHRLMPPQWGLDLHRNFRRTFSDLGSVSEKQNTSFLSFQKRVYCYPHVKPSLGDALGNPISAKQNLYHSQLEISVIYSLSDLDDV